MRRPGAVNRFWLIVIGVLLLLGGLCGLGIGTGLLQPLLDRWLAGMQLPDRSSTVFAGLDLTQFTRPGPQTLLLGVVGGVLLLLGSAWIIRQLPRRSGIGTYRLHDDARRGTVTLQSRVLADGLAARVGELSGVTAVSVALAGTAEHPVVRMIITADAQADLPQVIRGARDRIVEDLAVALDAWVEQLAVQLEISAHPVATDEVVLRAPA